MDRKFNEPMLSFSLPKVALRKESVDRKILCPESAPYEAPSLSARRAWIEKTTYLEISSMEDVALRKESVDRKILGFGFVFCHVLSLSARRAWIEKTLQCPVPKSLCVALRKESVDRKGRASKPPTVSQVALRKESVDRKIFITLRCSPVSGRSPQGERG